jgi:RNA polymerase sigma factor (sigma-70 family)
VNVKTDEELLRAFVDRGDETAFRVLVDRHIQAVHAAARRQIRDNQLAEDVTQATFVMLARKARSIRDGAVLGGWLITTARLAAKTALRGENRRKRREQRAATMSLQDEQSRRTDPDSEAIDRDDMLKRVDVQLDDALARLNPADRTAVTLRYLQSRPLREVAEIMGTTEQAAAKRVTRAVAKLKQAFGRHDIDLTPAAVIAALERQAQIPIPPGLADNAAAAAKSADAGAAATAIATQAIAHASLRAAIIAATLTFAAITAFVTVAIVASQSSKPASVTLQLPPPPATPATQPVLRVGVYFSHNTAVHPMKDGRPRGWSDQVKILDEVKPFPGLDLRPLIEPGTETEPQTAQKLKQHLPGKRPIDVTDAAAMARELDVILICAVCEPPQPALDAIESAVRGGTGLVVRQCLGGHSDGLGGYAHPQVRLLRGMHDADPNMVTGKSGELTVEVTAAHPLLGALGRPGTKLAMTIYGGYGTLEKGSTALIELRDIKTLHHLYDHTTVELKPGWSFVPLGIMQLDKGRIVSCNFPVSSLPRELDRATNGKFTVNALKWAAHRELD